MLSLVDVRECPEYVVVPDTLPSRFFLFRDNLRNPIVAGAGASGPTDAEYDGGFSRVRCLGGAVARSARASAALLDRPGVGWDVLDWFVWCAGDMVRKGEIRSAASVIGCEALRLCENPETGELSGDVISRLKLVAEWTGDVT